MEDMRDIAKKAREEAARLWCLPNHSNKQMDAEFCESIAQALQVWMEKVAKLEEDLREYKWEWEMAEDDTLDGDASISPVYFLFNDKF
jgi:hypothetical protein